MLNNIANALGGQPKDQFILNNLIRIRMYLYTYSQCASFGPNPKNTPIPSITPMISRKNISGYTGVTMIAIMITKITQNL